MALTVVTGERGTLVELNVVPLIDILLVLLVIFMTIAPLESKGLPVEIPQPAEGPSQMKSRPDPGAVVVEVLDDGSTRLNQQVVSATELQQRLGQIFAGCVSPVAFIQSGSQIQFARVAEVIELMRSAGAARIGLLTPGLAHVPGIV